MLLRCRAVAADLRLVFWLLVLLVRVMLGGWLRTAAHALGWDPSREHGGVGAPGRISLLFIREQPWALMLYALCLLAGDTSRTSR
jgi:hypothetical protein